MKKIFTFIIASFVATSIFAQQPLNPSFENWSAAVNGELPDGWDGTNLSVSGINVENVFKDNTAPQEGTYSARLETIKKTVILTDLLVPGILTLGDISVDLMATTPLTIDGGMEYSDKPSQFTGYYKYAPINIDTAVIGIVFYNGTDTICEASIEITDASSTWTQFTIDLVYDGGLSPDTVNILCTSSNNQDIDNEGSVLELDNFKFTGGTLGINKLAETLDFNISPNPANTYVNVNIANVNNDVKIVLHNTVGQEVYSNYYSNTSIINERINISEFNAGIYFIEVINGEKSSIKKLIIR